MVHFHKKEIKGNDYWYLRETKWIDGKSKVIWQKYLGTIDKIKEVFEHNEKVPSVKVSSFEFGKTAAILRISEELEFCQCVNQNVTKKEIEGLSVGEYMLLIILGRTNGPLSKQATAEWFNESFLKFQWKFPHKLNSQNFLNNMDFLNEETIRKIEGNIAAKLIEKGIKPTTIFWDTTNVFSYIESGEKLPQKGRSKEKRHDKNLVTFGIAESDENIPLLHETYPGNVHDAKIFPEMIDKLVDRLRNLKINTSDMTVVFDKGNNSEDNIYKIIGKYLFSWEKIPGNDNPRLIAYLIQKFNIEWVKAAKIKKNDDGKTIRIASETNFLSLTLNDDKTNVHLEIDDGRSDKFIVGTENDEVKIYLENMHVVGSLKHNQVKALMEVPLSEYNFLYKSSKVNEVYGYKTKKKVFGQEFTIVVSYNSKSQAKKEKKYKETKVKILEKLAELKKKTEPENGKKKKITRKGLCTNANKIIYSNLSTIFKYKIPEEGKVSFEYWVDTTAEETFKNSFGKIAIFTDLHDSSPADIARTYFAKNLVEEDFKFLKDKLLIPVPPFFMRKDGRIRVHVFLCVMGMLFYRYLAKKVKYVGLSIKELQHQLEGIRMAFVKNNETSKISLVVEEMNPIQAKLFSRLELNEFLI
jgi:transposase